MLDQRQAARTGSDVATASPALNKTPKSINLVYITTKEQPTMTYPTADATVRELEAAELERVG
ncbi:MAG: hypothetical protein JWQ74_554 [Marmoricola sp.]|nr:hypothetical protein [Marmoricola sp.]